MTDKNLADVENVEIDALSDEDLEDVAGGGCTCSISSSGCSNKPNAQIESV